MLELFVELSSRRDAGVCRLTYDLGCLQSCPSETPSVAIRGGAPSLGSLVSVRSGLHFIAVTFSGVELCYHLPTCTSAIMDVISLFPWAVSRVAECGCQMRRVAGARSSSHPWLTTPILL